MPFTDTRLIDEYDMDKKVETISTFLSGKIPEQHEESLAESVLSH